MGTSSDLLRGLCVSLWLISVTGVEAVAQPSDRMAAIQADLDRQAYSAALNQLRPLVDAGDVEAMAVLAHMYRRGIGVPQDYGRAVELDQRAAQSGVARSQNALAHALLTGFGVLPDPDAAMSWFLQAAMTGDARYQFDYAVALGSGPTPDYAAAATWYGRAAAQGHVEAKTNLGLLYLRGQGVAQDAAEAERLFREAAEAGDAQAQNNLGLLYVRGVGVEQNYEVAADWFSRAESQGLAAAMRNLSILHESGFGMPVDEDAARALLARARSIEMGSVDALLDRLGVPFDSRLVEPDWAQSIDPSENVAAEAGETVALYRTAFRYIGGFGVRQNVAEGLRRFEQAARQGSGAAALNLCVIYANGSGVPQSYRTALVWCSVAAFRGQAGAAEVRDRLILALPAETVEAAQQDVPGILSAVNSRP